VTMAKTVKVTIFNMMLLQSARLRVPEERP
jgi:hypothetical protein